MCSISSAWKFCAVRKARYSARVPRAARCATFEIAWTNTNYRMIYANFGHNGMNYSTNTRTSSTFASAQQNQWLTQSILYVADSLQGAPRELLDPNKLSSDGTIALAGWSVSDDGKRMAYSLASAGSDWNEWKVLLLSLPRQDTTPKAG